MLHLCTVFTFPVGETCPHTTWRAACKAVSTLLVSEQGDAD